MKFNVLSTSSLNNGSWDAATMLWGSLYHTKKLVQPTALAKTSAKRQQTWTSEHVSLQMIPALAFQLPQLRRGGTEVTYLWQALFKLQICEEIWDNLSCTIVIGTQGLLTENNNFEENSFVASCRAAFKLMFVEENAWWNQGQLDSQLVQLNKSSYSESVRKRGCLFPSL